RLGLEPLRKALDVVLGDGASILVTQHVFQQHLERERQARNAAQSVLLGRHKAVIDVGLGADLEDFSALETVERGHGLSLIPLGGALPFCGMLLPKLATLLLPPVTSSNVSEIVARAAYKVFLNALPYLGHMPGMMQHDTPHVVDKVNVFTSNQCRARA